MAAKTRCPFRSRQSPVHDKNEQDLVRRRFPWFVLVGLITSSLGGRAQTTISLVGNNVVLSFPTASNMLYSVQRADTLATNAWSIIASNIVGTGMTMTNIDAGAATAASRFYRISAYNPSTNGGTAVVLVRFLDGTPVLNALVVLSHSGTPLKSGYTDGNGQCLFINVSVGTFTVEAYSPDNGNVTANGSGSISGTGSRATTTVNLPGSGSVEVWIDYASGDPAPAAPIYVVSGTLTNGPGFTDSAGHLTMSGVLQGNFMVTAYNPTNLNLFVTASGNLATNGASAVFDLSLP